MSTASLANNWFLMYGVAYNMRNKHILADPCIVKGWANSSVIKEHKSGGPHYRIDHVPCLSYQMILAVDENWQLQANIHIYDLRSHHEAHYMKNLTIKRKVPRTQFAWLNKWSIWYSIVLDLLSGVEKQALSTKLPRMAKSHIFSLLIEPSVARQIKKQGQTITIEKKFLVEETDGYSAGRFSLNVTTAASTCRWTDLKINLIVKIKMLTYFTSLLICIMQPEMFWTWY